jgi:hypothetical protein
LGKGEAGATEQTDLDSDGVLDIYEYFVDGARRDYTNPGYDANAPYVPFMPATIYMPSDPNVYRPGLGYAEHPHYYEWNGTSQLLAMLDVDISGPAGCTVDVSPYPKHPDPYQYLVDTTVVLTPVPQSGYHFEEWQIRDLTDPSNDRTDGSNPLILVADRDYEVTAVFACGPGVEQALPLLLIGMLMCGLVSRRIRRSHRR